MNMMRQIDGEGVQARKSRRLKRRKYYSKVGPYYIIIIITIDSYMYVHTGT